jgi:ribonucleoside-diphosphate reductase alpha chain
MLGLKYDEQPALAWTRNLMQNLCYNAYSASIELAKERGPFPYFDREKYLQGTFIKNLPEEIRTGIAQYGIRNSHLIAIAPTGTISLLANNVSSGIEPIFNLSYERTVLNEDGGSSVYTLTDYAYQLWSNTYGRSANVPDVFITAHQVAPEKHIEMQALIQQYVDNAVSKTINIPQDYSYKEYASIYMLAYNKGLKGCTTFRPNPVTGEILSPLHPHNLISSTCCEIPG